MQISWIDLTIFISYCIIILLVGILSSRKKKGVEQNSADYFLAGRSLNWWVIGASIIGANISAEQFIGMSGSGYAIGLAMATYEWIAALGLIIVAKWFLPIFLQKQIYTMPQFLEMRFDKRVKTVMTFFWLSVFIFINLTSILYLGSLAIESLLGIPLIYGIIFLALFASVYTIYGGLKAVAMTESVQIVVLIGGGLLTTYVAVSMLGDGNGVIQGFENMYNLSREKFHLILDPSNPGYKDMPGLSVIIGGLWVANLYYWGCNQYIVQRSLAAKSLKEAQKGMQFAAILKLFVPLLVVLPGIAVYSMGIQFDKSDQAYPWLLTHVVPVGVRGLAFAALIGAIVSALASMINGISTIFTMDIYKEYTKKEVSEKRLILVGRVCSAVALIIAVIIAPILSSLDQAFQYIQEFTGFISPGALAIFLTGFFYKKATANGALFAAFGTFIFSTILKLLYPELPWMDRMFIVFFLCLFSIIISALIERKGENPKAIKFTPGMFKTAKLFNIISIIILLILIFFYVNWW